MKQHYRCSWFFESPRRLFYVTLLAVLILSLFYGSYIGAEPWIRSHRLKFGFEVVEPSSHVIFPNDSPLAALLGASQAPQSFKNAKEGTETGRKYQGYRSLAVDSKILNKNFRKLKEATKKHSGRYHKRFHQTMTCHIPVVDTSAWVPHSPSGKEFSIDEVHFLAKSTIQRGFLVPNIAHFVLPFTETNLRFHHMVSLLSCLNVMKPHRLLLWYSNGKLPSGQWWDRVRNNLTDSDWEERIIFVQRPIPTSVYTVPVHGKEHQSDVMRLEAVLIFGGVYMDIDVLVLKSLEPLRKYPCTIGRELPYGLCNGIFMSAPGGTFLAMWHTAYQVFNDNAWGDHSVKLPSTMQAAFPDLCHVEEESMDRPNWTPREANWIYGIGQQGKWDWRRKNYAMHLWFRKYGKQHNMDSIKTLDSMYGEMCRFILYGNS